MTTPISDFVRAYGESGTSRFHMPGHKGKAFLGFENRDITEIDGADVLYSPSGIIAQSEENATFLFDSAHTFYSAEGSTLCIKAMLAIICKSKKSDTPPLVLAGRGAHKAFLYAAGLLDLRVEWLYSNSGHICGNKVTPDDIAKKMGSMREKPDAVYLTSPDYLGNVLDIRGIAEVLKPFDIPLLVDNAHGAYLKFLPENQHPLALGAAMCADSAHKTLPVLTGGAYLHVSRGYEKYLPYAREALSIFASTSPSYLILQSLDECNAYLADEYPEKLSQAVKRTDELKSRLSVAGYSIAKGEKCKIVFKTREFGYTGEDFAHLLYEKGVSCEFCDSDFCVLMVSSENDFFDFERLWDSVTSLPVLPPLTSDGGKSPLKLRQAMTVREALFAPSETLPVRQSVGRVCAAVSVSCPPAVPIVIVGEVIDGEATELLLRYGIEQIRVVKKCSEKLSKTD